LTQVFYFLFDAIFFNLTRTFFYMRSHCGPPYLDHLGHFLPAAEILLNNSTKNKAIITKLTDN